MSYNHLIIIVANELIKMKLTLSELQKQTKHCKTLADYLHSAEKCLTKYDSYFGHGTDNAWDEAIVLLFFALDLPLESTDEVLTRELTLSEISIFHDLLLKRINDNLPAAYITNKAYFAGLEFYVDKRVLIPRSPLAELIERQCTPWISPEQVHHILDLCTGSGCIAIAIAKYFPDALVDAVDISSDALAVAKINIEKNQCQDQVKLIQSDLLQDLPAKKYDIIISNPPYVEVAEYQDLPAEYYHEPKLGLEAGDRGLDCVTPILQHAKEFLTPEGILIVEVGNSAEALAESYPQLPFIWLEFSRGGDGVFLLTAKDLIKSEL